MSAGFIDEVMGHFWLVAAIFLRMGPAISLSPGFGESFVSTRIKLATALTFSVAVAPVAEPYLPDIALSGTSLFWFVLIETLIGFFLGIMARATIILLEKAGAVISQSVSMAQMLGNATEPMPVIGHVLMTAGLAFFFSTSLVDQMLHAFAASYIAEIPSLSDILAYFARQVTRALNFVFNHGVVLASGFMSLFFVYYLCIGFINKAMPQFMVSFIGIPFVALLSIYVLHQHSELILTVWQDKAMTLLRMPFESPR